MANPEHVNIVKQGATAIRRWREANPDTRLDLGGADLLDADLCGADLRRADLREAELTGVNLYEALLLSADLRGTNLSLANLGRANLADADLARAWLDGTNLSRTNLDNVRGAERAHCLETARFIPGESIEALGLDSDVLHFEECQRPWPERWLDWERLRGVGQLPLFGLSYTALILIPIAFYGLALYNDKIELVRAWAEPVIALPDHPWHRLASLICWCART